MKRIHAVLLVIGASWFAFALWVVASNVILRETRLGVVAQLLDRLPPVLARLDWSHRFRIETPST
jgi:hypothetical protein